MSLVIRLRRLGNNSFRTYVIDESSYMVPLGTLEEQRNAVINQIMEHINEAAVLKSEAKVCIKHKPQNVLRFTPSEYKMCTVEWED